MSQQKVDKYKEEKKNRKKTLKLQKVKKALAVLIVSLGIGAIIGIPLGKAIYKYQKAEAEKHKTIEATAYGQWFDEMWADSYANLGSNSDADLQKLLEDYYNSSSTDASATDAE